MPGVRVHRRGSVYLLVLGVAMIVAMIGVTSSRLIILRRAGASASQDAIGSQALARSAIEIVLTRINADSTWRTTNVSGVWSSPEPLAGGEFIWMIEDADGNLANDPSTPATLHVRAIVGAATRMLRVGLDPSTSGSAPNILLDPGFEGATGDWYRFFCTIAVDTADKMEGTQSMSVTVRSLTSGAPTQSLVGLIDPATSYDVGFWIKISGASRQVRANVSGYSPTSGGFLDASPWVSVPADTWTYISTTLSTSWTGTPAMATFSIYTDAGTEDFHLDDVSMSISPKEIVRIASGSWRREVLP